MVKKLAAIGVFFSFVVAHAAQSPEYFYQLDKRHPSEKGTKGGPKFFDVPLVRQSLDAAVPRDWQLAMENELTVAVPNRLVDGYLVVSGCKPHFCPDKNYVASIRISDGAALFIVFDDDLGQIKNPKPRCFSTAFVDVTKLPQSVRSELVARDGISSTDDNSLTCTSGKQ